MASRIVAACIRFLPLWLLLSLAWPGHAQAQPAFPATGTVTQNANLRSGPAATYARTGSAPAGSTLTLAGCNAACDWYETADGAWIAAFLVEVESGAVPVPGVGGQPATVTRIVDGDTTRALCLSGLYWRRGRGNR